MDKRGFSLIEVVVAFGILLAGVIPILSMYPSIVRMNQKTKIAENRIRMAGSTIDYIKVMGYRDLRDLVINTQSLRDGEIFNITKVSDGVYTSADFETRFNCADLFVLNSNGVDLTDANIWVMLNQGKIESKDSTVLNPAGGKIWLEEVLVGGVVIGTGDEDLTKRTKKSTEYELRFSAMELEDYP